MAKKKRKKKKKVKKSRKALNSRKKTRKVKKSRKASKPKKNKALSRLPLIKQSRLSVMPIDYKSWKIIDKMSKIKSV